MSFFNNKEEVINIELTPLGKTLFSKGKFNPKFYCFFDDDIIYDSTCYGLTENQNNTQQRILEETPYLKPNHRFSQCNTEKDIEYSNYLGVPLTSTDDSFQKAPAFNLSFKSGEIDNVELDSQETYNRYGSVIIPQINLKPKTVRIKIKGSYFDTDNPLEEGESYPFEIKPDDSYVTMEVPKIKFEIFEENVEELMTNFDIEVYKIENGVSEKLLFESFDPYENTIINDILENEPKIVDFRSESGFKPEDKRKVSSYYVISLDENDTSGEDGDTKLFIYDKIADITPRGNKC